MDKKHATAIFVPAKLFDMLIRVSLCLTIWLYGLAENLNGSTNGFPGADNRRCWFVVKKSFEYNMLR
jgi:hypothetical protein